MLTFRMGDYTQPLKSDPTCFSQKFYSTSNKVISPQHFDGRGQSIRFYDKVMSLEMFSPNFEEKSKIFPPHSSEEVFTFNPIRLSESLGHFLSYDPSKGELVNKRRMTSRRTRSFPAWWWSISRKPCRLS